MGHRHVHIIVVLVIVLGTAARGKDTSRKQDYNAGYRVADVEVGDRTVTTAVWYPTRATAKKHTYGSARSSNTGQIATNAPLAGTDDQQFPFLLYSHGFGGSALGHTYLGESLARDGWIVVAPDHIDAVNVARIGSGRNPRGARRLLPEARKLVQSGRNFDFNKYAYRMEDVQAVVKHVMSMQNFAGHIDETKMAIGGHSFGGYTSAGICGARDKFYDDRFDALILHSPGLWMYTKKDFAKLRVPVLYMLGEKETETRRIGRKKKEWAELVLETVKAPGHYAEVKNGRHTAFNTAQRNNMFSRLLAGSPQQLRAVRRRTVAFLNYHLLNQQDARTTLHKNAPSLSEHWTNERAKKE